MTQSFQIFGSQGDGRSFGRRPIVLARLPHVGAPLQSVEPTRTETAELTFAQATRFYVDPRHAGAVPRHPEPVEERSEPRNTSHRRRHDSHRRPRVENAPLARLHEPGPATTRFPSYSGLVATFVLAASAVLMYWMLVIPSQNSVPDFGNSYDTYGATQIELPRFDFPATPPTPAPAPPQAVVETIAPMPPAQAPEVVAPVEIAPEPPVAPASTLTAVAPAVSEPAPPAETKPVVESNSDLIPMPEVIPAPEITPEVIYNDASAAIAPYPTTDHPLASAITVLGIAEDSHVDGAMFFPVPQVARQPETTMTR